MRSVIRYSGSKGRDRVPVDLGSERLIVDATEVMSHAKSLIMERLYNPLADILGTLVIH